MQGLPIDYLDQLQKFCKAKNFFLIEDAAPALGSYVKNKAVGSYGDFGCFSFHETKNYHGQNSYFISSITLKVKFF